MIVLIRWKLPSMHQVHGVWSLLVNLPVVTVSVAIEVGSGTHHKQEAGANSPLMCSNTTS